MNIGGMVMGFVIHTNAIATGKLAEKIIALGAANNIWNGTGIKAQNKPTAKALEIDFRNCIGVDYQSHHHATDFLCLLQNRCLGFGDRY
jgi:hypothetical protein